MNSSLITVSYDTVTRIELLRRTHVSSRRQRRVDGVHAQLSLLLVVFRRKRRQIEEAKVTNGSELISTCGMVNHSFSHSIFAVFVSSYVPRNAHAMISICALLFIEMRNFCFWGFGQSRVYVLNHAYCDPSPESLYPNIYHQSSEHFDFRDCGGASKFVRFFNAQGS